jgi:hypothetical protein
VRSIGAKDVIVHHDEKQRSELLLLFAKTDHLVEENFERINLALVICDEALVTHDFEEAGE